MFDPSNPDIQCTKFPKDKIDNRFSSTGNLIDNIPTICGGIKFNEFNGKKNLKTCNALGNPKMSMEMLESRTQATSVLLNSTTLWVIGGYNERDIVLDSTELLTWGKIQSRYLYRTLAMKKIKIMIGLQTLKYVKFPIPNFRWRPQASGGRMGEQVEFLCAARG